MTLEQLMKSKGYSDQEMSDLKPLLSNAKFRADLEAELSNGEKAVADLDNYDKWFTTEITPEHEKLMGRVAEAEANAAAEKARFEAFQKAGMKRQAGQQDPAAMAAAAEEEARKAREAAGRGGVDMSKFVTSDVFQGAYEKTGEAIASAIDITTQHMQLFPGQYLNMEQLRNEARTAKKSVKDFWETKYGIAGKRAELVQKAETEKEARIRADERQKMQVEFGGSNPSLAAGYPSNNPFVIRKAKPEGTKQPWEKNTNELSRDRIQKAIEGAAKRGELVS